MKTIEIRENEIFVRIAFFPSYAEVLIKENEEIRFGDPIAVAAIFEKITKVSWSGDLNGENLPIVKIGDTVKKGEALIGKTGMFSRIVASPCDGRIISITPSAIYIEEGKALSKILSPFTGRIKFVSGNRYEVEMFGDSIQGVWGNEINAQGMLRLANEREILEPNTLVAIEGDLSEDELSEILESDCAGVVFAGVNAALASRIIRSKKAVVLLGGFGATRFSSPARKLLNHNTGRLAILSGRIEDPLLGVFPEIIFPRLQDENNQSKINSNKMKNAALVCSLNGTTRFGVITKSSQNRVKVSSGIQDHVVEVIFEDGSREIIPRSQVKKLI